MATGDDRDDLADENSKKRPTMAGKGELMFLMPGEDAVNLTDDELQAIVDHLHAQWDANEPDPPKDPAATESED